MSIKSELIEELDKLDDQQQQQVLEFIHELTVPVADEIDEDAEDAKWEASFADPRSKILIAEMAEKALKARDEGKTIKLD